MKRLQYIVLCGLLLLVAACEKDTLPMNFSPALTTGEVSGIFRVGATLSGTIQKSDGVVVKDCGILISELQSMAEYTEIKTSSTENTFEVLAQNLEPGKKYYYCAYASSGYSIARGEIKEFTTTDSNAPVFSELEVNSKDEKSFTVATTILDEGGSELILCGFCWKLSEGDSAEPTVEDNVSNVSVGTAAISVRIKDLKPNRNYLVRAYGINAKGVGYGKTVAVSTNNATAPVVSSITPTDSTALSVSVKAGILSEGESGISEIGFCWSAESQEPTTAHLKYDATEQLGHASFNTTISGLKEETTYYIRAYAINNQGTGYGDIYTFTTGKNVEPGIYSLEDLLEFRDAKSIEGDLSRWRNAEGVINIFADIDATSVNWAIKGSYGARQNVDVIEGNGHTISINILADDSTSDNREAAFISYNSGTIRNLTIAGTIKVSTATTNMGGFHVSAFCVSNHGLIYNCHNQADITCSGDFVAGHGICGGNYGTIENCTNSGTIKSMNSACGISSVSHGGKIINCHNYGTIELLESEWYSDYAAGIAGYVGTGEISGCTNEGKIIATTASTTYAGGIGARMFGGTITNCINKGEIVGRSCTGGIAAEAHLDADNNGWGEGSTSATISNCRNEGSVTGGDPTTTGGICGVLGNGAVLSNNMNGGTVNGAAGTDTNSIGRDERD